MNTPRPADRDERTSAVADASLARAYIFVLLALYIDVMFRSILRHEVPWDLMALALVSSIGAAIYQVRHNIWTRSIWRTAVLAGLFGAVGGMVFSVVANIWFPSLFTP